MTPLIRIVALVTMAILATGGTASASPDRVAHDPRSDSDRQTGPLRLPTPPMQHRRWIPPGFPQEPSLIAVTATLFKQGLPDPRGCEYREFETLKIDPVWALLGERGSLSLEKQEGWILPRESRSEQAFAIGWDGVIYRAETVGEAADLSAYVNGLIERRTNTEGRRALLQTCMLLRLGEVEPAAAMLTAKRKDEAGWVDYLEPAGQWTDSLFKLGISARMRGLDSLSETCLREYQRACDQIVPEGRRRLGEQARYDGDDLLSMFGFNDEQRNIVKRLIADQARRRRKPAGAPRTLEVVLRISEQKERIKALVDLLDEVNTQALPLDDPGFPDLSKDPIVQALTREGIAAFPALLRSYKNDNRMTRSVSHWRWNQTNGEMARAGDAAVAALFPLLDGASQKALNAHVEAKKPAPDKWPTVIQHWLREWWKRTKPTIKAASGISPAAR